MSSIPSRIFHAVLVALHKVLTVSQYEIATEAVKMLEQSEILSLGKPR